MDELITSDGIRIELEEGIPIPLNLAIADFREPDKRQRNFSKEIDLPGTAANMEYFASACNVTQIGGAFDFNSSAKVNCTYYKRGVPILPNAVLKLNKISVLDGVITFKVGIFSDFVDVFLLLSTINIKDLDWSDYNHTLTNVNIENSWSTPLGTGYYYPLIERNQRPSISQWRNTDMIPYVHGVDIFNRCMALVGQKFTSATLETTRAKSILYGYGGGNYVDNSVSPAEQNNRKVSLTDGVMNYSQERNIAPKFDIYGDPLPAVQGTAYFSEIWFTPTIQQPAPAPIIFVEAQDIYAQMQDNVFTAQRSGFYNIAFTGTIRNEYTGAFTYSGGGGVYLRYRKNGVPSNVLFLEQTSADQTFAINTNFNVFLDSGDELVLTLTNATLTYNNGTPNTLITRNVTTPVDVEILYTCIETALAEGSNVEMGRFLPSMKASDFVLGFIRLLNLMISDPDLYGVVKIESMANFYQGTDVFTDISDEVDELREIEIRPSANEFAKTLNYVWKQGTETDAKDYLSKWGQNYGDLSFDQPSFFAKGEQKIELPFATIIPYQVTPDLLVPRFVDVDNTGAKKTTSGMPRLMFRNGLKNGAWQLVGSTTNNYTTYPCVHHFDDWEDPTFDLNFKLVDEVFYNATIVTTVNSYSVNYSPFVNEIISPEGKYVQLYRKMNELTVQQLDWTKLLMWNGALFRFNKVVDFDSEITESTKIEMLKVIEAKNRNRIAIAPSVRVPSIYGKVIQSPFNSVGAGVKVISGGAGDQVLAANKRIVG